MYPDAFATSFCESFIPSKSGTAHVRRQMAYALAGGPITGPSMLLLQEAVTPDTKGCKELSIGRVFCLLDMPLD